MELIKTCFILFISLSYTRKLKPQWLLKQKWLAILHFALGKILLNSLLIECWNFFSNWHLTFNIYIILDIYIFFVAKEWNCKGNSNNCKFMQIILCSALWDITSDPVNKIIIIPLFLKQEDTLVYVKQCASVSVSIFFELVSSNFFLHKKMIIKIPSYFLCDQRPEIVEDFVRNFLVKMGMVRTLDCFQTEW